ncbi:uncharacterized protein [Dermacentor albipictus]|uniref:uncharacterized protein n=1 Tax=Dermacentor albipictus TaxID=60249 RepID=UPI0038FCFEB1
MATQVGPPIFDEGDDKWDAYQVRLEAFFEAHEIVDPKKRRALLVAALSTKTVDLLAGRCAPNRIQDLTYEAAVQKLAEYFAPKGNEIAESYQFFTRNQLADESTSDFIVELRKMANRCNFGQALERMLRDRLVCGLRNAGVRRNLLARHTLTLQEAEDVALAAEMAARNVQQMGDGPIREGVHAVRTKQERQKFSRRPQPDRMKNSNNEVQTGCLCCGSDTHKTAKCRFRRVECFSCRKRGHLASMCNSKPHQENVAHCEEPSSDSEDYGQFLLHLRESSTGLVRPIWQTLQWKGVPVKMQVDTGSPVSIVTWPTYAQHRHRWPRLDKSSLQLSCFLGRLPVKGQLKIPVTYGGKTANATLVVLGCSGPNLCGRDIIQAFQLTGGSVLNVDVNDGKPPAPDQIAIADTLRAEYADLFSPGLGLIKGPPVHLQLREGTIPRFCKARSIPYALQEPVNAEIAKLADTGILTQVASAEWAAPLVPVVKKDGSIRLCGDFRTTVNTACHTEQYPLPKIRDIFAKLSGGEVFRALPRRHSHTQPVWCKDYRAGASWRPGVIQNTRGARLSTVKTEDGELCERHEDQLRHRADAQQPTSLDEEGAERNGGLAPPNEDADPLAGFSGTSPNSSASEEHETGAANTGVPEEHDTGTANAGPLAVPIRRSTRRRKAPDRFQSSS